MSGLRSRTDWGPDGPANYAPRHARETAAGRVPIRRNPESDDHPALSALLNEWPRDGRLPAAFGGLGLQPETMQPPRGRSRMMVLSIVAAAIVVIGLAAVGTYSYQQIAPARANPPVRADVPVRDQQMPTLTVENGHAAVNEALPLGLKVTALTSGATVYLKGLPRDTRLTAGTPVAAGEWRIAVKDLPVAAVVPPRDFTGAMIFTAELRDAGDRVIFSDSVHLTWTALVPKPAEAAKSRPPEDPRIAANATADALRKITSAEPTVAKPQLPEEPRVVANTAVETVRKMAPAELAALIKRGEDLTSGGDLPAARLLLQRAAETRDPQAAFALAATYDPVVVRRVAPNSSSFDVALARTWYQKARDWGSREASRKLEALASADR